VGPVLNITAECLGRANATHGVTRGSRAASRRRGAVAELVALTEPLTDFVERNVAPRPTG
jgi:hypothetical protein